MILQRLTIILHSKNSKTMDSGFFTTIRPITIATPQSFNIHSVELQKNKRPREKRAANTTVKMNQRERKTSLSVGETMLARWLFHRSKNAERASAHRSNNAARASARDWMPSCMPSLATGYGSHTQRLNRGEQSRCWWVHFHRLLFTVGIAWLFVGGGWWCCCDHRLKFAAWSVERRHDDSDRWQPKWTTKGGTQQFRR